MPASNVSFGIHPVVACRYEINAGILQIPYAFAAWCCIMCGCAGHKYGAVNTHGMPGTLDSTVFTLDLLHSPHHHCFQLVSYMNSGVDHNGQQ